MSAFFESCAPAPRPSSDPPAGSTPEESGARHVYDLFRMGAIELGLAEVEPRSVSAWMGIHS
jgi:hypothetical protein